MPFRRVLNFDGKEAKIEGIEGILSPIIYDGKVLPNSSWF